MSSSSVSLGGFIDKGRDDMINIPKLLAEWPVAGEPC